MPLQHKSNHIIYSASYLLILCRDKNVRQRGGGGGPLEKMKFFCLFCFLLVSLALTQCTYIYTWWVAVIVTKVTTYNEIRGAYN